MIRSVLFYGLVASSAHAELSATFKAGEATDSRLDRLPAILVEAGEPATPFVAPGAFEVTWTGKLTVAERQRLTFSFEGNGTAALTIDGKPILEESGTLGSKTSESTRLNPGDHEISITFKSQPDGSGRFRLFWEERSLFPKQSVPPSAFSTEAGDATKLGELQRKGRLLFAENNCAKCHVSATGFGATPMPETGEFAPLLAGIGDRVNEAWLKNWVAAPHTLRPSGHMPELVDGKTEAGRQQAADIAAFLSALKLGTPEGKEPEAAQATKGGEIFHTLGCVACHTRPDQTEPDRENKRIPLNNVASKFKPGALVSFLKKPDAMHPYSGMPDFRLSDEEAGSLAAFLTTSSKGKETKIESASSGNAAKGEELVKALNCGSCHPGLPMADKPTAPALDVVFSKDWSASGCAASVDKRGKVPVLNLTDDDRTALIAFSKTGTSPLTRDTPGEFTRRQITSQRCVSCHANDNQSSLLDIVHADSRQLVADLKHLDERVAQNRPQLTWLGEMLHVPYIESMIDGSANPRPRPWLLMRMPGFHSKAKGLAEGFARMHGVEPDTAQPVKIDAAEAEIGKSLAGTSGFGCVTCHGIGDLKPTAAFEVEGVNLKLAPTRLRDEYYYRWMHNPGAVTPGTKMPRYSEGNKSQRTDVLDGDAHKQFEAIWEYLNQK